MGKDAQLRRGWAKYADKALPRYFHKRGEETGHVDGLLSGLALLEHDAPRGQFEKVLTAWPVEAIEDHLNATIGYAKVLQHGFRPSTRFDRLVRYRWDKLSQHPQVARHQALQDDFNGQWMGQDIGEGIILVLEFVATTKDVKERYQEFLDLGFWKNEVVGGLLFGQDTARPTTEEARDRLSALRTRLREQYIEGVSLEKRYMRAATWATLWAEHEGSPGIMALRHFKGGIPSKEAVLTLENDISKYTSPINDLFGRRARRAEAVAEGEWQQFLDSVPAETPYLKQ